MEDFSLRKKEEFHHGKQGEGEKEYSGQFRKMGRSWEDKVGTGEVMMSTPSKKDRRERRGDFPR